MVAKHGDGPELSSLQIQDLAEELDISSPILSYRVVGERVELHLLGGSVAIGRLGEPPADLVVPDLASLTAKDLRKIAQAIAQAGLGQIPGAAKLRKAELVAALELIEPRILATAIEEALE